MNTNVNIDNRQRNYFQKFTADQKTIAVCIDGWKTGACTEANARIRIVKEDLRLPMTTFLAFDPDGGNPDNATMTAASSFDGAGTLATSPRIMIAELVLARRSYVPILKVSGSNFVNGGIEFPLRPGALGFAWQVSQECDAIDIYVRLPHALGELKSDIDGVKTYWGGRWVCGYSFACQDRLSREEWIQAVSKTNLMVDMRDNASDHIFEVPVIAKDIPG